MSDCIQFKSLCDLWASGELEELGRFNEKFNIFNSLKLNNAEIRHSNFLAWLMNPRESHELGDYFLKAFLELAIKDFVQDQRINIKPQDILGVRFYECEIKREDKNIDILIINPDNKFLCLIENKIWTGEHSKQLERYAEDVAKRYRDYKKLHLFLTPTPNPNETILERNGAHYIQMSYAQIIKAIDKTLRHRSNSMPIDVKTFIEHYKKMVERDIMKKVDEEVAIFCRKVYRNHKEAIDLINSQTNISTELIDNIKEIFKDDLIYLSEGMFALKKISEEPRLQHGNSRYGKDLILLQLEKAADGFTFSINIVTAEAGYENLRKDLIAFIENKLDISFSHNQQETWHYSNKQIISNDAYYDFDSLDEVRKYIKDKIEETRFTTDLREVLDEYFKGQK